MLREKVVDPERWLLQKVFIQINSNNNRTVVYWDRRNKVTQLNDREISGKKVVLSQSNPSNNILIAEINSLIINA
jgi:hypothetical protein